MIVVMPASLYAQKIVHETIGLSINELAFIVI